MILKREKICAVKHYETGLTFNVYRVDCFVESFICDAVPSYTFEVRYYETDTGQPVIPDPKKREGIWIVVTEKERLYVKQVS